MVELEVAIVNKKDHHWNDVTLEFDKSIKEICENHRSISTNWPHYSIADQEINHKYREAYQIRWYEPLERWAGWAHKHCTFLSKKITKIYINVSALKMQQKNRAKQNKHIKGCVSKTLMHHAKKCMKNEQYSIDRIRFTTLKLDMWLINAARVYCPPTNTFWIGPSKLIQYSFVGPFPAWNNNQYAAELYTIVTFYPPTQ